MKLWAKGVFLLNARIVAGRERRESGWKVFPTRVFPAWHSAPVPPPPPPLRKQLLRNKEALKCFPAQLRASQMSSCLPPVGSVPRGVDRPIRSPWQQQGLGGVRTHCTGSRICGSCCLRTEPLQRSTPSSGTPHTSYLLPSSAC